MLLLTGPFFCVCISDNDSFTITDDHYMCDQYGHRTEDGKYEGAALIIETNCSRYIIDGMPAYRVGAQDVIDEIRKQFDSDKIIIDLYDMICKRTGAGVDLDLAVEKQ